MANEVEIRVSADARTDQAFRRVREQVEGVGRAADSAAEDTSRAASRTGRSYEQAGQRAREAGETTTRTQRDAREETEATEQATSRWGDSLQRIGEVAGGVMVADLIENVGQAAVAQVQQAGKAASDLEQAVGGTTAVFGEANREIEQFAQNSAEAVGLSERAFREAATQIGGQLKRMTGDVELAAQASTDLVEIGADLAATYGGTTQEAVEAFGAALRGEADPAERFNLNLKQSVIQARAVEMGLADTTAEVDEAARAQALLAEVTEQSTDAQGNFAGSADTAAIAQQKASAAWEDAQAELGQALLPALTATSQALSAVLGLFTELPGAGQATIATVGALGAAFLLLAPRIVAARQAMQSMGVSMRTVAIRGGAVVGAITGIVSLLSVLGSSSEETSADVSKLAEDLQFLASTGRITGELERVAGGAGELGNALRGAADEAERIEQSGRAWEILLFGDLQKQRDQLKQIEALDESMARLVRSGEDADEVLQAIARAYGLNQEEIQLLLSLTSEYNQAAERQRDVTDEQRDAIEQLPPHLRVLQEEYGLTADEARTRNEEMREEWQKTQDQFIDGSQAIQDAQSDLREDQKLTTEMWLDELEKQREAQRNWHDNLTELMRQVPPELHEHLVEASAQELELLNSGSEEQLQRWIELMRSSGRTAGGQMMDEVRENFQEGAPALQAIAEQEGEEVANKIAQGMEENGTTVEQEARDQKLRIRENVEGDIIVEVIPRLDEGSTANVNMRLEREFGVGAAQIRAAGGPVGGLASGGASGMPRSAQAGGARGGADVLVGEQGPEIAQLPFGTRVVPSGQSQAMLGSGGGGTVAVQLIVRSEGGAADELVAELIRRTVRVEGAGDVQAAFGDS